MSSTIADIEALYVAQHDRVRSQLMRKGLSAAAAADLVQDVFLRMLRSPSDEVVNPQHYLLRAAGNIAVDEYRRQKRSSTVIDAHADIQDCEWVADPSPLQDVSVIAAEEFEALRSALAELPPRCREVLILHKFEGLSYAEIAAKLGIAKNTVTVHLAKAMRLLRRGLREAGTDVDLR
ncbi:RNA polymerase sigma factor [Hyphomicrobium sp. D-2]|uniref:RNA polymerase sigma factor n=1 Tax=Hyphomicrobium sp. D-2 TaxID=3041621 RepID=UPI002453FCDD|nr:RNA polymerase sigma factor [Hyphomicrobium sp. D-2]MDH4981225.1 RNA polymerase sigma factor [Hyphomicrobium sp. D-2]